MKKSYRIETHSVTLYVALQFLWVFLLLMITQLLFAWVNHGLFDVEGGVGRLLLGNLHFGLSGTAMVLSPFVILMALPLGWRYKKWYQAAARIVAGLCVFFLLAANIADIPYFQWTLRRTAGDIFGYLSQNFEGGSLVGQFLKDFWYYFLLFFILFFLWIFVSGRIVLAKGEKEPKLAMKIAKESATTLLLIFLCLTAIRGGWIVQHKPLAPVDASRYAVQGNQALVINTPFSILRTMGNASEIKKVSFFDDEEAMEEIYSPVHQPAMMLDNRGTNVVLLLLESFSEEFMGCINQGEESYTPFLDSLSRYCAVYQGRANGIRSIESIPSLMLGIPSLMNEAYITSTFSQNRTLSLPQILSGHGYESAFFHGAYNGSMNFDGFAQMIGFDHYYGMDEYGDQKDFDGTWGIFDEPFLQYAVKQMGELREPFFSTVYTISSHHPYTIPQQHKGRFKKGPIELMETVSYADYALRRFFESASKQPWFQNTLFVITADHSAQPQSEFYRKHAFRVPMFIYFPKGGYRGKTTQIMQHIDFMPTLLGFLGYEDTCFSFGHNVLADTTSFHICHPEGYYQLERNGNISTYNGEEFWQEREDKEDLDFLKAIIQQYCNRMIDNRLLP